MSLRKKNNQKSTLYSLLSERPSAEPNQYYRSNNQRQNERDLKEEDEKSNIKTILIVENAGVCIAEKEKTKVEINLEPMEDDPNKTFVPYRENVANDVSIPTGPKYNINDENTDINRRSGSIDAVVQIANNPAKSDDNLDSVQSSSPPGANLCSSRNSNFCSSHRTNNNSLNRISSTENTKVEKSPNANKFHGVVVTNIHVDCSEKQRNPDNKTLSVRNPINNDDSKRDSVISAFPIPCGRKTASICNQTSSFNSSSHNNYKQSLTCASRLRPFLPMPNSLCSFDGGNFEPFPKAEADFSWNSERIFSSASTSKQTCFACVQFQKHNAILRNQCQRNCAQEAAFVASRHCVKNSFDTAFAENQNHSCSDLHWHGAFPIDRHFPTQSTEENRRAVCFCCSSSDQNNPLSRTSPFISVSISGETQAKIIKLPFSEQEHSFKSPLQCSRESVFQACKRHLEAPCCGCIKDCNLCCSANHMAPSIVFLPSLLGFNTTTTETHCPCCYRIIREKKHIHEVHLSTDSDSIHPALHQYNNIELSTNEIPKSLGHFEISPTAYAKLLTFIESRRAALEKQPAVNRYDVQNTNVPENLLGGDELQFLTRKSHPPAFNKYASSSEQSAASKAYLNQTVGEMVLLAKVLETVEECPWYWGEISNIQAKAILQGSPLGTFLLRDSSDPRYLFSVSVMTSRGPTSIRIVYSNGSFRFDSDGDDSRGSRRNSGTNDPSEIPAHRRCVVRMILYYTNHLLVSKSNQTPNVSNLCSEADSKSTSSSSDDKSESNTNASGVNKSSERGQFMCSWMGRTGKKVMPVQIENPQPMKFLTLQKLSRACINNHIKLWKNLDKAQELPLPSSLQAYLKKYPYPI